MARYSTIITIVFLSLLFAEEAYPEACWMVGCEGNVGFIRIPAGQIERKVSNMIWNNGIKYTFDDKTLLFKKPGLPKVNSIVKVNTMTSISSEWNGDVRIIDYKKAERIVKEFGLKTKDYIFDDNAMVAKSMQYEGWGGWIGKGSKIQILSYITCKASDGEVTLAFVKIISDENE